MKILPGVVTLNEDGVDLKALVREVLKECKVEVDCSCVDTCGPYPNVNDALRTALQLLAQRVLELENRVTLLEA